MTKGAYEFRVRTYECGPDGRATLPTICNYLQEAASVNAESLGFSKTNFDAAGSGISWVLTRLLVKMEEYPRWEDVVTVETFPRGGRKIVAWRDFELKASDGRRLGAATSEWMLIDLATRKIVPIPEAVFGCLDPSLAPVLGADPFTPRLKFPCDAPSAAPLSFRAQRSHIDLNGHVNNVHYIEWMLECDHPATCTSMEVVFRSETLAGDEVRVDTAAAGGALYHRVHSPDARDHILARTEWKT